MVVYRYFFLSQNQKHETKTTTQQSTTIPTSQMSATPPNWSSETPELEINVDDGVTDAQPEDPTNKNIPRQEEGKTHTSRQMRGAAAVGGLAGLVLCGPLIAVAAAGACAVAVTSKSKAGDVARSGGDGASKGFGKGRKWIERRLKPKDNKAGAPSPSTNPTTQGEDEVSS
jgi:hypothetical protein